MDELKPEQRKEISRRRMIKRVGTGAAIAWSAPVLTSLATPAFAQRPYGRCPTCAERPDQGCVNQPSCGDENENCTCLLTTEDTCFCHGVSSCGDLTACSSSADCQPGFACAYSCCDPTGGQAFCTPGCSTGASRAQGGTMTTGGRMTTG